jgi:hypothetical protein
MTLKLQKTFYSIAVASTAKKQFDLTNVALDVCLNEFPNHRGAKTLHSVLPYLKKSDLIYWLFQGILGLYRILKIARLTVKYGKFSKNLISQLQ